MIFTVSSPTRISRSPIGRYWASSPRLLDGAFAGPTRPIDLGLERRVLLAVPELDHRRLGHVQGVAPTDHVAPRQRNFEFLYRRQIEVVGVVERGDRQGG
jgi:hypothetical protein